MVGTFQAAEKAMRGVQLSVDAESSHTKYLPHACWDDVHVRDKAQQLEVRGNSIANL